MSEPEELIEKADALMSRHRRPRTPADPPSDIPVLTEIIELPYYDEGWPAVPHTAASGEALTVPVLNETVPVELVLPAFRPPAPSETEIAEAVADSVRAALINDLQPEIDRQIVERLKLTLEPLVEKMFTDLRDDLQAVSREIVAEAVKAAVEREIALRRKDG